MKKNEHELKCWTEYFTQVANGSKRFEIRKNDRGFAIGDTILLKEYCPDSCLYSGRDFTVTITSMIRDVDGIAPGYVILGIYHKEEIDYAQLMRDPNQ